MTDVIQLLPDSVANQIAAGEVIQRPASVVKELVENAVDAGAKTINVLVQDAGRTSIQVVDDGCGMSETDARLAFERHATSKIRQAADLFSLHTMGFRGEALPSIVAVAQVELRTRRASDEVGTLLRIAGSRVESQEPCSCAVGSSFTVSNLFYNVPARRKFLKSNATELNNILQAFERIVLVYPDIAFTLHSNGQELLNLRAGSLRQRITDIFGRRYGQDLLPVNVDTSLCRITGFTAKPEAARKKATHEYFFVNGRYMRHPYFHRAVQQAYERLVPTGAHVPYFIYFTVDPADIDVNIHPTKTEIKFENEQPIWQILAAAVKDAIGQFAELTQIDFDTEGRPDIPAYNPGTVRADGPNGLSGANGLSGVKELKGFDGAEGSHSGYNPFNTKPSRDWQRLYADLPKHPDAGGGSLFGDDEQPESIDLSPSHYQYKGRYVMTAVKSGLMVVDQHRADLRIRYERYLHHLHTAAAPSQQLLFPETVELTAAEAALIPTLLPLLRNIGFVVTGEPDAPLYTITAMPAGLEGLSPAALLRDLLVTGSTATLHHDVALTLARRSAIPYGQLLSNDEMDALINHLFQCTDVNHTPDGQPVLAILPQRDLDALF